MAVVFREDAVAARVEDKGAGDRGSPFPFLAPWRVAGASGARVRRAKLRRWGGKDGCLRVRSSFVGSSSEFDPSPMSCHPRFSPRFGRNNSGSRRTCAIRLGCFVPQRPAPANSRGHFPLSPLTSRLPILRLRVERRLSDLLDPSDFPSRHGFHEDTYPTVYL